MSTADEIASPQPASIGVVVPAYNERLALPAALDRLVRDHDFEQLVVVDASDDEQSKRISAQLADAAHGAKWNNRLTVLTRAVAGRGNQMNAGARLMGTDAIVFLHVDTVLPAHAMDAVRGQLRAGAQWGRFNVTIDDPHPGFRIIETMMNLRSAVSGICTGDQSIFVRTPLFNAAGGFGNLVLMEDIDLSKRLKRRHRPAIIRSRVTTSARRWRQNGILRTILLMWTLRLGFWFGVSPERLARWYRQSNETTK